MYAFDPAQPWRGRSPLSFASLSAALMGAIEHALMSDASTPVVSIIPTSTPQLGGYSESQDVGDNKTEVDVLSNAIDASMRGRAKGAVVTMPSATEGRDRRQQRPLTDWDVKRLGPKPETASVSLRSDAAQSVLSAMGVPPALYDPIAASANREAWRQFLHGSVAPVALVLQEELRRKFDAPALTPQVRCAHGQRHTGPREVVFNQWSTLWSWRLKRGSTPNRPCALPA